MYLAFDPGKTTGWALFGSDGEAIEYGQASLTELMGLCEGWREGDLTAVIYEDWLLFKHKAPKMVGSRMEASQAIGIIKNLAHATGAELVQQPSNIKSIAQMQTQIKPPSNHAQSHWVDAFNHGAYYLIRKGIRRTALEREQDGL